MCQKCGAPLNQSALEGLCGRCLGKFAFAADLTDEPAGTASPRQGHPFGDYILLDEIARGGMGVVYRALQKKLNRVVALKLILHGPFSNEEFLRRFQTEAKAAAKLHHPNIVTIHEIGEHEGHHFLSMEYIEGKNLAEVVLEKPLTPRRAAAYLRTVARAIQYAHDCGVVHRDLKPSNLLLDQFDEPRITDFGLAKLLNTEVHLTTTGQAIGSPVYMAPEQAAGHGATAPSLADVYSLGAVLYHLVTGRPPFHGSTVQDVLLQSQNTEPVSPRRLNPAVPMDLETVILKCLQKEPAKRYASARQLADDLDRFLSDRPILARPVSNLEKLYRVCRRYPISAGLTAALTLVLVIGVSGIVVEWHRAELHAQGEERQRLLTQDYAKRTRLDLYAADISVAARAIEQSDYGLARRTLSSLSPWPGGEDLRGFEWRYLMNLCRGEQLATLPGHSWIVTCATFSPDGRVLVTGSQDSSTKIWDVENRRLIRSISDTGGAIWSVGFSPDGQWLMTAGNVRHVQFWDWANSNLVVTFPGQLGVLSRTGSLLATADSSPFFWEKTGKVAVWDYRSRTKLKEWEQPGRCLAISPDNQFLAVAGPQKDISFYEISSGERIRVFPTDNSIWSLAFSPDGNFLVASGWTKDALLWDLRKDSPPRKLSGHGRNLWSVFFSPDGSRLATTSSDQTIRLWDTQTLQSIETLQGHDNEVWCAAFRPDGKMLASGGKDQMVMLWSTDEQHSIARLPNLRHNQPIFSRNGQMILISTPRQNGRQSQLVELTGQRNVVTFDTVEAVGFFSVSNQVITLNRDLAQLEFCPLVNSVSTSKVKLESVTPGEAAFECVGVSPAGEAFFAVGADGTIRLWETGTGRLVAKFDGPKPPMRCAEFGPQGRRLALSVEHENFVRLYDVHRGTEMQLSGHRDFVSGVAFSPDGATLASGSVDGMLKLWDCSSGRERATLPGHPAETSGVAFSPDGRTLASIGHQDSVKLWHVATRRQLFSIPLPEAGKFVQFSPDGRYLVVAADDDTLRFFDTK